MKYFNTTIIGLGKIGMGYDLHQKKTIKTHYKACLNNKKIKVTSVIDTDENKLTQVTFKKNKIKTYLSSDYILKKKKYKYDYNISSYNNSF